MSFEKGPARWAGIVLVASVIGMLPACEMLGRAKAKIGELMAVQRAVQQRVGLSPVNINVMNGSTLTVSIVNTPFHDLAADSKKAKARELAQVALEAYAGRAQLQRIVVVFVVQRGFLLFHYTDGTDAHFFQADELRGAPALPASSTRRVEPARWWI